MFRALVISALIFLAERARAGDAFYVWQRQWNSAVVSAVTNEPATEIYFLATVVPERGTSERTRVPWAELARTEHRYTPVIRVPLSAFDRIEEIARVANEYPDFDEIQIDLDCPERRLSDYAENLIRLREKIPHQRLTITALPAHLGHRAFRDVVAAVDEYTLQVHGLDTPKHLDDPAELMNASIALKALERAERLGHPFRLALPCYAYELNFDPTNGTFLFLTAEGPASRRETTKKRAAARSEDLLEASEKAERLIWFRLPVAGDRLCLPRETLAEIQAGRIPADEVETHIETVGKGVFELRLRNANVIHATTAELTLEWPEPPSAQDLYRGVESRERTPTRLTLPLPPPGRTAKIGWFASPRAPTLHLELK